MKQAVKIAICLMLMLALTCGMAYLALAEEADLPEGSEGAEEGETESIYWDGTVATEFAGGTGTAEDPFLISTPAQFAYFSYLRNNYVLMDDKKTAYADMCYRLTNDLYFNRDFDNTNLAGDYTLAASEQKGLIKMDPLHGETTFSGVFDGGGYGLYNLYMTNSGSLFGQVSGIIRNLHVVGGYTGIKANRGGTFASAVIQATALSVDEDRTGLIEHCTTSMTLVVSPLQNWSTVEHVGGIAGTIALTETKEGVSGVHHCEYSGLLYVKGTVVGGIIGSATYGGSAIEIVGCVNRGIVLAPSGVRMGGIIGSVANNNLSYMNQLHLKDCYNFGTVQTNKRASKDNDVYVGGLVGYTVRCNNRTFDRCGNLGTVSAYYGNYVGGLVGRDANDQNGRDTTVFNNCIVYGNVTGANSVGGFIGGSRYSLTLNQCVMDATVTATGSKVGGIVGMINTSGYAGMAMNIDLHSCDIRGTVTGADSVGGLVGEWHASGVGTGIRLMGTLFIPSVKGRTNVAGGVGNILNVFNGKTLAFSLVSSLFGPTVTREYIDPANLGTVGLFSAGKVAEVTVKTGDLTNSYLTGKVYGKEMGEDALIPITVPTVVGQTDITEVGGWRAEYLTDGTLLDLLNNYKAQNNFTNPGWEKRSDNTPAHRISARLSYVKVEKEYDERPLGLPVVSGCTVLSTTVQWYAYSELDQKYHMIGEAPDMIGTYRLTIVMETDQGLGSITLDAHITATTFDLSKMKWDYEGPLRFNGSEQSVTLANCPAIFSVRYDNATYRDAGVYIASATVTDPTGNCNLIGSVPTLEWEILKVRIDGSTIRWNYDPANPPMYTGETITVTLTGNQSVLDALDVEYQGGNVGVDANQYNQPYQANATLSYETANVQFINPPGKVTEENGVSVCQMPTLSWQIMPRVLDLSVIDLENQTAEYDGTPHDLIFPAVDLLFDIPGGVLTAEHIGQAQTAPGVYDYQMIVSLDPAVSANYRLIGDTVHRATLTVERAQPRILAQGADKTYDGLPLEVPRAYLALGNEQLELPLTYTYYLLDEAGNRTRVDSAVNGGTYEVVVSFAGNALYKPAETTVKLYVNRAQITLPNNITLRDETFRYMEGVEQNLKISGTLPPEVTPVYTEPRIYPGVYTVVVKLQVDERNYMPLPDLTATMTILSYEIFDRDFDADYYAELESGELSSYNLKVYNRKDFGDFRTRQFGMFTSMKAVYRYVIRDGYTATQPEEPLLIHIPLSNAILAAEELYVVRITVNERGGYTYERIPVVDKFNRRDEDEFACIIDYEAGEVIIKSLTTDTYGIITSDPSDTAYLWLYILLGIGGVSALMAAGAFIYRKRRGKPKVI